MAVTETGTSETWDSNANSGSQSITIPADCDLVVWTFSGYSGQAHLSITADISSNSMTVAAEAGDGNFDQDMYMTYLASPPTGSQTFNWDFSGSTTHDEGMHRVIYYKGVDTSSPVRGTDTDDSNAAGETLSGNVASDTGDYILISCGGWTGDGNATQSDHGTGQTEIYYNTNGDSDFSVGTKAGATTSTSWSITGDYPGVVVASIKEATGGTVSAGFMTTNRGFWGP